MVIIKKQTEQEDKTSTLINELIKKANDEQTKESFYKTFLTQCKKPRYTKAGVELIILFDTSTKDYSFEFKEFNNYGYNPKENNLVVCGKELTIHRSELRFDSRVPSVKLLKQAIKQRYEQNENNRYYDSYSFFFQKEEAVVIQNWLFSLLKNGLSEFIEVIQSYRLNNHTMEEAHKQFVQGRIPIHCLSKEEQLSFLIELIKQTEARMTDNKTMEYCLKPIIGSDRAEVVNVSMNAFEEFFIEQESFSLLIKGLLVDQYKPKALIGLINALSELSTEGKKQFHDYLETIISTNNDKTVFLVKTINSFITHKEFYDNRELLLFESKLKTLFEKNKKIKLQLIDFLIQESYYSAKNYGFSRETFMRIIRILLFSIIDELNVKEQEYVFLLKEELISDKTEGEKAVINGVYNSLMAQLVEKTDERIVVLAKPVWQLKNPERTKTSFFNHDRILPSLKFAFVNKSMEFINHLHSKNDEVFVSTDDYSLLQKSLRRFRELVTDSELPVFIDQNYQGQSGDDNCSSLVKKQLEELNELECSIQLIDLNDYDQSKDFSDSEFLSLFIQAKKE